MSENIFELIDIPELIGCHDEVAIVSKIMYERFSVADSWRTYFSATNLKSSFADLAIMYVTSVIVSDDVTAEVALVFCSNKITPYGITIRRFCHDKLIASSTEIYRFYEGGLLSAPISVDDVDL